VILLFCSFFDIIIIERVNGNPRNKFINKTIITRYYIVQLNLFSPLYVQFSCVLYWIISYGYFPFTEPRPQIETREQQTSQGCMYNAPYNLKFFQSWPI